MSPTNVWTNTSIYLSQQLLTYLFCSIQIMKDQAFFRDQTEQYVQQIKGGTSAILVMVRVRPLSQKQLQINNIETVRVMDGKVLSLIDVGNDLSTDTLKRNRNKETQYAFDYVYDKDVKTKQIYDQSISMLIDGLIDGYNSTVLTYGATGCGKTFTMIGENGNQGIIPLSMIDLLSRLQNQRKSKNVIVRLSYIEIYNENIKDLLISEDKNFEIREDPKEGINIPGITQLTINSMIELNTVLKVAHKNRSKEATGANQASSRSHAILIVKVDTKQKVQAIKEETNSGKFCLVDLAGSQRANSTTNRGMRMIQGAKINKSLLVLGNCIQSLSQASEKGLKKAFIPYRGSKLTRLLKESLGGNCRTILIANISPFINYFQDTYNTLLYANRAKNIKNNATRNVLNAQTHLSNYVNVINNLKKENDELKKYIRKTDESGSKGSLPQLKNSGSSAYNNEIQRLQNLIDSHFKTQSNILEAIHEVALKIDKIGFNLFKLELEGSEFNQSSREYTDNKNGIEQLSETKLQLQNRLQKKVLERGKIVQEIKSNEVIGNIGIPYLMAHYKQKKTDIELEQINFKQKKIQIQIKEKDLIMSYLKKELKLRDKIIQDQKVILKKNNIINRITYSRMNAQSFQSKLDQFLSIQEPKSVTSSPRNAKLIKNLSEMEYTERIKKAKINTDLNQKKSSLKKAYLMKKPSKPYFRKADKINENSTEEGYDQRNRSKEEIIQVAQIRIGGKLSKNAISPSQKSKNEVNNLFREQKSQKLIKKSQQKDQKPKKSKKNHQLDHVYMQR